MKPISLLSRVLGITLVMITVACQKEVPLSSTEDNLNATGSQHLKSTINTANLDELILIIAGKVQSGEISKGNGNALIVKINTAQKNIEKGQLKAAENVLNAFINQVNSLVADGVLTSTTGELLTKMAYEVFNPPSWKCGDNFIDARDRHIYKSLRIGNQCWMGNNLAYLPAVSYSSQGSETTPSKAIPYYYVLDYEGTDVTQAKAQTNYSTYGVLYNWFAAKLSCPFGWHLPSDEEWSTLSAYLGSSAGGKLKETGFQHWFYPNTGATNETGFTALPHGNRMDGGGFGGHGNSAAFWSSTSSTYQSWAWYSNLSFDNDIVYRDYYIPSFGWGVRCIKD